MILYVTFFIKTNRDFMEFLFRYGRRVIYTCALLWAVLLYHLVTIQFPTTSSALSALMRQYAFTAIFLLYVVLTPGLLLSYFPRFRYNPILIHLRRALGVSVFFFGGLHATLAFINNLSGSLASVLFLSPRNQWALIFSTTALSVFFAMALTSFDWAVRRLGKYWKVLHRLVYIAALLVVFHAFFIGSHFTVPTNFIPLFVNFLSLAFIFLEVGATVKRRLLVYPGFSKKNRILFGVLAVFLIMACMASYKGLTTRYDPHAAHRKGYSQNYTLNMTSDPRDVTPGSPVKLTFQVVDKRTGRPLTKYQTLMEKLMHVVVLRRDLLSYDHIHPDYDGKDTFTITHTFPTDGTYFLFVEYSPPDFYENLSVAKLTVGSLSNDKSASISVGEFTKIFSENYRVTLKVPENIKVNDTVDFTFTLADAKSGIPIEDLETYLGSFGHMSAASEDLGTYTHVHPITVPLAPSDRGGPTVEFSTFFPKPGKYKLFTQFKHKGVVFVTDFVVEVK